MLERIRGKRWDIFCSVVDNLGDIGVCWRLSRDLTRRYGVCVRLWVDDLDALRCICPEVRDVLAFVDGVEIRLWEKVFAETDAADCVIEAFACELPPPYVAAMARRHAPPLWVNLEYLSAENWVAGCHGLASPHPSLPLIKYFYFPGFTPDTGGLLREEDILQNRRQFQASPHERAAFLAGIGAPPPSAQTLVATLFAYHLPQLPALLPIWSQMDRPLLLLVPQGRILGDIAEFTGGGALRDGKAMTCRSLTIAAVPFLPQQDYDRLLWSADVNFVRGEDSFVRAQWAGSPFVWQIYRQADSAHVDKLRAFMDIFCAGLEERAARGMQHFWLAWNGCGDVADSWADYYACLPALAAHGQKWLEKLSAQDDLTTGLVKFYLSRLK